MLDLNKFKDLENLTIEENLELSLLKKVLEDSTQPGSETRKVYVTRPDLPDLEEYVHYLLEIWDTKWLTNEGQMVQLFENRMKDFLGLKYFAAVSNGTSALQIAIKALNLKGSVVTTPFTFIATTNCLLWEGLKPVFADIDPETFNLDPQDVERKIRSDTSAILAVHNYGNPCDVLELGRIAEENDLALIYDGAHAFNVQYARGSLLEYGDITTMSFHATKVFHTIEGGALVTQDRGLLEKIRLLRNHGIASEEEVILTGINAKMNEFQASMGLCNLEHALRNIEIRKIYYEFYKQSLEDLDVKFQKITASKYNYAYMPICFKDEKTRNKIFNILTQFDYHPRKYFYPLITDFDYIQKSSNLESKHDLKVARKVSNSILCLPLYPNLSLGDIDEIINIIRVVLE